MNYLKKGSLEFTKTDLSTDEPLPNTLIEVYTENDEMIFSGRTDENGKITIKDIVVEVLKDLGNGEKGQD